MKGEKGMKCEHKRVKSENCVVSCMDCGTILPDYFKTPGNGAKRAGEPLADAKSDKSPGRKRKA